MTKDKLKLTKWDVTDHLKTKQDIKSFLQEAFEEAGDDSAFIIKVVSVAVRAYGIDKMAGKIGFTTPALTTELSPDGGLEFATFIKIINVFGIKLTLVKA